jgi:flagellar protein FliS
MTTEMPAADARARYLADAVATATPAKRIVLLYDRLWLDIQRAQAALDCADPAARDHLEHAQRIVAELLNESMESQPGRLATVSRIVADLRSSWQQAEEQLADRTDPTTREAVRVG